ncbi:22408_t:CDS:1, partial [Gigaspora rosea]
SPPYNSSLMGNSAKCEPPKFQGHHKIRKSVMPSMPKSLMSSSEPSELSLTTSSSNTDFKPIR